ncbi:MAG: hypothetical protein GY801_26525 [bacterium]|nr:hypothetical protein [bacterium]
MLTDEEKTTLHLKITRLPQAHTPAEQLGELGMDHYEVRKYAGWCHHILTCLFPHAFCGISRAR